MYEYLEGTLESKDAPEVVLDVGGVGFLIQVSGRTATRLPEQQVTLRLYVHEHHLENEAPRLYGFSDRLERSVFRHLISVSRVGPAAALSLLTTFDPEEIVLAIVHGEAEHLARAKGVGKKTVERMVVELRESFRKLSLEVGMKRGSARSAMATDLMHVLVGLGFPSQQAQRRVEELIDRNPEADLETLLRLAMG